MRDEWSALSRAFIPPPKARRESWKRGQRESKSYKREKRGYEIPSLGHDRAVVNMISAAVVICTGLAQHGPTSNQLWMGKGLRV